MLLKSLRENDVVRIGRHGVPMKVLRVWPIGGFAVVSDGGERHLVAFHEVEVMSGVTT